MSSEAANPYVGPRPFSVRDRNRFFGRDREANDLIPLVISGRVVLFYAQSGAGKSSLINARLVPGLVERNFIVLPVARVSGHEAGDLPVDNIFVYNLLLNLERDSTRANPARLAKMTIKDYLADLEITPTNREEITLRKEQPAQLVDAPEVIDGVQPMALIIDQFEEIFTTHPEAWSQRGPFFQQLCEALEADPYLWVVFSIREDYVAMLDPYAYMLPGRLQSRFYMQRMGSFAALEAVKKPVENIRPFDPGVAEKLVTNLSQIVISRAGEKPVYAEGQYIEPVQLQVVCYQLWENLKNQAVEGTGNHITEEDLNRLTGDSDLAEFVSRALGQFYTDAITGVMAEINQSSSPVKVSERQLRAWFSEELITEAETRGAVRMGSERTGSMPNSVVRMLQEKFIIRSETRGGNTWIELSHDRFVAPILQANRDWYIHHPRQVLNDAEAWESSGRDRARLYEGRQLRAAVLEMETHPDEMSDLEREFIRAGQAAADSNRSRRQRMITAVLAIALLFMAFLVFNATRSAQRATAAQLTAEYQKSIVDSQRSTAVAAQQIAAEERDKAFAAEATALVDRAAALEAEATAQSDRATAVAAGQEEAIQRQTAVAAQALAEDREEAAIIAQNEAQAGRLASLADYFRQSQTDLSVLLSISAVNLFDTWETRRALLDGIQRGLETDISQEGQRLVLDSDADSLAVKPGDGSFYVLGKYNGKVEVRNMSGSGIPFRVPPEFESSSSITALAFDSDGNFLARGSGDGRVPLLEIGTLRVLRVIMPFGQQWTTINALAFQPKSDVAKGELLAMATAIDPVRKKGLVFIHNYQTDKAQFTVECGSTECLELAWSPDGTKLAVGNKAGDLQVVDVTNRREILNVPRAHQDALTGLAWMDNQRLISGGLDQRIIQWDTATGTILDSTNRQDTPIVLSMALSADGRYLLVGRTNATGGIQTANPTGLDALPWVTMWNAETLELVDRVNDKLYLHSQPVAEVAFSPAGNRFVSSGLENILYVWKFEPVDPLSRVIQNIKGNILALSEEEGNLRYAQTLTDVQIGVSLVGEETPRVFKGTGTKMAFATIDGKDSLVYGDFNGLVYFLDPKTGAENRASIRAARGGVQSLAVSPDGQTLAVAYCLGNRLCDNVRLRSLATDAEKELDLKNLELGVVSALAFSPDNNLLAIGSSDGKIILYNLSTDTYEQLLTEGLSQRNVKLTVTSLAFSPADAGLLAAGLGKRVALWKVDSRGPIGDLGERATGDITALTFHQEDDGGTWKLITGTGSGEIREWEVDPRDWIARGCQISRRDLTQAEREKFLDGNDVQTTCSPAQ